MSNIPQHCIDKFKKDFTYEPSIIQIQLNTDDRLKKLISKSRTIWFSSIYIDYGIFFKEKLVEYDAMGIYIYILWNEDSSIINVTFMTTIDRQSVTEFAIHNLNKK